MLSEEGAIVRPRQEQQTGGKHVRRRHDRRKHAGVQQCNLANPADFHIQQRHQDGRAADVLPRGRKLRVAVYAGKWRLGC